GERDIPIPLAAEDGRSVPPCGLVRHVRAIVEAAGSVSQPPFKVRFYHFRPAAPWWGAASHWYGCPVAPVASPGPCQARRSRGARWAAHSAWQALGRGQGGGPEIAELLDPFGHGAQGELVWPYRAGGYLVPGDRRGDRGPWMPARGIGRRRVARDAVLCVVDGHALPLVCSAGGNRDLVRVLLGQLGGDAPHPVAHRREVVDGFERDEDVQSPPAAGLWVAVDTLRRQRVADQQRSVQHRGEVHLVARVEVEHGPVRLFQAVCGRKPNMKLDRAALRVPEQSRRVRD